MKQWAIANENGLYYGTASSRKLAIAQHVCAFNLALHERGFPFYQNDPLDDLQKKIWAAAKRRGDRAVKVNVEILNR